MRSTFAILIQSEDYGTRRMLGSFASHRHMEKVESSRLHQMGTGEQILYVIANMLRAVDPQTLSPAGVNPSPFFEG